MVKVKICGITNGNDARTAVQCGAWGLGFIFYKKSPRSVSPFKAAKIIGELPPFVTPVGVFVDQKEGAVRDIAQFCGLRTLQFHGDETPEYCRRFKNFFLIKAFRVHEDFDFFDPEAYKTSAYLFDTHQPGQFGGSGRTFPWKILEGRTFSRPVILSGGLNPDNVAEAIQTVRPYAVDVSSGVEISPGKKDDKLLEKFSKKIRDISQGIEK